MRPLHAASCRTTKALNLFVIDFFRTLLHFMRVKSYFVTHEESSGVQRYARKLVNCAVGITALLGASEIGAVIFAVRPCDIDGGVYGHH
jgi:hypothetical protein